MGHAAPARGLESGNRSAFRGTSGLPGLSPAETASHFPVIGLQKHRDQTAQIRSRCSEGGALLDQSLHILVCPGFPGVG